MTGFEFLDLIIGLSFIYFISGLVVSVIQEIRANILKLRFHNLEAWVSDTFAKGDLAAAIMDHDLIKQLVKKGRKPSYIPPKHFIQALLDVVHSEKNGNTPYNINTLRESVEQSDKLPSDLKRYILQSIYEAQGEIEKVRTELAAWFNNNMDRISGTYKVIQQRAMLVISFVVVAMLNVDTISISRFLYENPQEREALANAAAKTSQDTLLVQLYQKYVAADSVQPGDSANAAIVREIKESLGDIKAINEKIADYRLPLGWKKSEIGGHLQPLDISYWLNKLIGLIISALAVSLGAPFWYDLLNKLVSLRVAGNKPKVDNEPSKNTKDAG